MRQLIIDNYLIDAPLLNIIKDIQFSLTNGKLRDIFDKGDNIVVTCPVHDNGHENKPAGFVYCGEDEKIPYGFFKCFVCDTKLPFYKFVAACFDKSDDFAKKWLIDRYGVQIKEKISLGSDIVFRQSSVKSINKPKIIDLSQFQSYCQYLQKRKISREICELFDVKYDSVQRQILFPCYDERGNFVMLASRKIDYKQFNLEKDIEKPVYGLDKIINKNIKQCILTEGPFDCLTAWSYGFPAIASLGSISDSQIQRINNSSINTLLLMFDNDDAGRRFTERVKKAISPRIFVEVVNIPAGFKDINDLDYETFWNLLKKFIKKQ